MTLLGTKADFSQRDPKWSGDKLGFAKWQTMGGYGCYVAGLANIAQAHGKDVTPADMNHLLKEKEQFVVDSVGEKSDVKSPGSLSVVFPDIKNVENKTWGSKLADINFFDIRSSKTDDILVMIDYHPERAGVQTHFCRVIGINAARDDVEVVDSYTGKRIWLSSLGRAANKLIYKAYKYRGPGAGFTAGIPASPAPKMVNIRMNGLKTQKWNVRTSPGMGDNVRSDGQALGGQTYSAEVVAGGWARILFRSRVGFVGPKTFTKG